jgi:hypothetical protein
MTDEPKDAGESEEAPAEEVESPALSALLKRSLSADSEAATEGDAVLRGVQQKLRVRSKGKFYADGWSTNHSRVNYVLVAAIMLVTIVAVYLALGPIGISLH